MTDDTTSTNASHFLAISDQCSSVAERRINIIALLGIMVVAW